MQAGDLIHIQVGPDMDCWSAHVELYELNLDSRLSWFQKREVRRAVDATLDSLDMLFSQVV
jgi:hypothetical protein